jgi:hypothetical protein
MSLLPSHCVTARLTVVTAADEAYWRTLWQFLLSAQRRKIDGQARIVVFDLGLESETLASLRRRFPWVVFRTFEFARYPAHAALLALTYAWKPLAIAEVAAEFEGALIWLDCATLFKTRDLSQLRMALTRDGTYVLKGASSLAERCDAQTLASLDVPHAFFGRRERPAGVVGLDMQRPAVRRLIEEWRGLALSEDHIRPRRPGHNPEQALLSILLFRHEADGAIGLAEGEIDISSASPVRWLSTRNKVPNWVPVWADPFSRLYYFLYKTLDQAWLGFQRRRRMGHKAR